MRTARGAVAICLLLTVAACGTAQESAMPSVVGQRLDVAQSDIERAGFDGEVEVVGGGLFGVVDESNWEVCDQVPPAGAPMTGAPRLTVDRTCGTDEETAEEPEEHASGDPEVDIPDYQGPAYDVVVVDENVGPARLRHHWVHVQELDPSTPGYKDQVKAVIEDLARNEGSDEFLADVVTDPEIARAEASSTMQGFVAEHGDDYFLDVIPEKEKTGWIASYAGGVDADTAQPSDADVAFTVIWMIASDTPEIERWKPVVP